MKTARHLLDGIKLAALFGAIALVVWTMPEHRVTDAGTTYEAAAIGR